MAGARAPLQRRLLIIEIAEAVIPQKTAVLHLEQGGVHDHGRPSHKHVILAPRQTGQGLGDLRHAHLASGTVHQAITVSADNGPNVLQVLGKLIDDLKRPETIGGETDNIPHMRA